MKTKFVLASVFAAISGLAGFTSTANAKSNVHLSINIGPPRPIVVVPHVERRGSDYGYSIRGSDHRNYAAPRGYWKEIVVKTWVPGHWVVTRGYRGREVRSYSPGRHVVHTDRVWVSHDVGHGHRNHRRG